MAKSSICLCAPTMISGHLELKPNRGVFFGLFPSFFFFFLLVSGLLPSQPLIKWQLFVFIVLPSIPIQFLTAFPLSWILLSLLYSNPLPSCLYYHPSVSELGYLLFNPLIGFLPSDLFASSECNLTLPATTHPPCSLSVLPLHLLALTTFWCYFLFFPDNLVLYFFSQRRAL